MKSEKIGRKKRERKKIEDSNNASRKSKILLYSSKMDNYYRDYCHLHVRGGRGGNGSKSYNGIGGNGGNVLVVGSNKPLPHSGRYIAGNGEDCNAYSLKKGRHGDDMMIYVPLGTSVIDAKTKEVLGNINTLNQQLIVAEGGIGGSEFSNLPYSCKKIQAKNIIMEVKTIADIGLIGFPNAGKSTFLSTVSEATPKIASYPFTTIRPSIGVLQLPSGKTLKVADLPGLIPGAHKNVGLGYKFLKHIERTKFLIFLIDINGFQLKESIELSQYNKLLLTNPSLVVFNKIDLYPEEEREKKERELLDNKTLKKILLNLKVQRVLLISTQRKIGLEKIIEEIEIWNKLCDKKKLKEESKDPQKTIKFDIDE